MIVIRMGTTALVDYEALLIHTQRAEATIRKHCKPATTHPDTGVLLYDIKLARKALAEVPERRRKAAS